MAKVIFFASIREELDCDQLDVEIPDEATLSQLIDKVTRGRAETWRTALTAENVRVAVNQDLVSGDVSISNSDEIAFFPPVTGG